MLTNRAASRRANAQPARNAPLGELALQLRQGVGQVIAAADVARGQFQRAADQELPDEQKSDQPAATDSGRRSRAESDTFRRCRAARRPVRSTPARRKAPERPPRSSRPCACGPPIVPMNSGIVMNGPTPTMLATLSDVACTNPMPRAARRRRWRKAAVFSQAMTAFTASRLRCARAGARRQSQPFDGALRRGGVAAQYTRDSRRGELVVAPRQQPTLAKDALSSRSPETCGPRQTARRPQKPAS